MTKENRCIIFDLDGVLIDSKDIHFHALNKAILKVTGNEDYVISYSDHLTIYDGYPTTSKLRMLHENKHLPINYWDDIVKDKKKYTKEMLKDEIRYSQKFVDIMKYLKDQDFFISVASNAITETVNVCVNNLGIAHYVDFIVSNEMVETPKPFPEIYWKCMIEAQALPKDTIIIEDSAVGREGAYASGANVMPVKSLDNVTMERIKNMVVSTSGKKTKWVDSDLTVVIPMAGRGSRFEQQGYTFPKPLIDMNGKPMIQVVTENLGLDARFVYIVQREHYEKYNLKLTLNLISPDCEIVIIDGVTEGAACTVLEAKKYFDNEHPLIIANSDQFIEWDANETMYSLHESGVDGGILTFKSTHPKWSYAKLDEDGLVSEVAEKKPISDNATCGIYYWRHGWDFVKSAQEMIDADDRVNGEFYVAPTFNYAIKNGKKITIKEVEEMHGIGVPEDLNTFLALKKTF